MADSPKLASRSGFTPDAQSAASTSSGSFRPAQPSRKVRAVASTPVMRFSLTQRTPRTQELPLRTLSPQQVTVSGLMLTGKPNAERGFVNS